MNDHIELAREVAEELEVLLRKIGHASNRREDFVALQRAGLAEAIQVYADALEEAIEHARESSSR